MPKRSTKPSSPPKQTACARCPLKTLPMFRAFQANELEFIEWFKTGEFVTDAGATILMEGHNSQHLYTVLHGWAFRYKTLPDGRKASSVNILTYVDKNSFTGESVDRQSGGQLLPSTGVVTIIRKTETE